MTIPVVGTINWMSLLLGILLGMFVVPWVRGRVGI